MPSVKLIAELGINHNGDLNLLCRMAVTAIAAGADVVKIQKRNIDECYSPEELRKPCSSPWGSTVEDKVRGRELSEEQVHKFADLCHQQGILWTASCFDLRSLEWLNERYNVPFNKIPSALAMRTEFLEAVAEKKILTLISTGLLGSCEKIQMAANVFEKHQCSYVINHCVALSPCPPERVNLRVIPELQRIFLTDAGYLCCKAIGYSGHEVSLLPSILAAAQGALYIERHFTMDRSMYGADQAASVEPQGFHRLRRDIDMIEKVLGDGDKALKGDEKNPVTFWKGQSTQ